LKAAWFGDSTLETYKVIFWFQNFLFKWVKLVYRYVMAMGGMGGMGGGMGGMGGGMGGMDGGMGGGMGGGMSGMGGGMGGGGMGGGGMGGGGMGGGGGGGGGGRFDNGGALGGAVRVDSPWPIAERCLVPRWFQPLHLSSEEAVSKCAFEMQLAPLQSGMGGGAFRGGGGGGGGRGGGSGSTCYAFQKVGLNVYT
jgi:hypothetical protein